MRTTLSLNGKDWRILGLLPTEWVWRRLGEADTDLDRLQPAPPPWLPATVPGDVPSDLRDAGEIPDPWFDRNSRACEWVSQRDWVYRKEFEAPPEMRGKTTIRLCFAGVDYHCHVFLNGVHLGEHAGMYDPFAFEVTEALRWDAPNRLLVVVVHAPLEPDNQGQIGFTSQIRLWKARFAYDWDWCTRLIPLGIWQDVTLEADDGVRFDEVWVRPRLRAETEEAAVADIHITARVWSAREQTVGLAVRLVGSEREGEMGGAVTLKPGLQEITTTFPLYEPRLWYPNGSGGQPLYTVRLALEPEAGRALDAREARFGVRQVRFAPNDDTAEDARPYVLEVNGLQTFLKGWNWVPIDQLYGRPHTEKYRHWIRLAKEANCNLLRVWGGGLLEREIFYDLCDEAGILVWQEFIQSSSGIDNEPGQDADYLAYCRDQAEKMIPQRRNHPSLLLWGGGNELMTRDWKPLTDDHPNMVVLRETVARLDPDRPFLPSSPSGPVFGAAVEKVGEMHDVHGPWQYLGDPEHYRFYNAIDPLLHSEFGVEGAANVEALARFLPPDALWPPDASNPSWVHHGAWWLNRARVEALFGPLDNLEDFVRASQWIQAEGLRYGVEANRRRKWRTAGVIPWQFNEAWPNASCTNVVDYYGQPKPAYWWVRRAYAPFLISARYEKLHWQPGATFEADLWLNCDARVTAGLGGKFRVNWRLVELRSGRTLAEDFAAAPLAAAAKPLCLARVRCPLPADFRGVFALQIGGLLNAQFHEAPSPILERNDYLFSTAEGAPFAELLRLPPTHLEIRRVSTAPSETGGRALTLRNVGDTPALFVHLALPDAPLGVTLDGDYRTLASGERRWFRFQTSPGQTLPEDLTVSVSAWNVAPRRLRL